MRYQVNLRGIVALKRKMWRYHVRALEGKYMKLGDKNQNCLH